MSDIFRNSELDADELRANARDSEPNPAADFFRTMAHRIVRNRADKFGGAFVIVPPGEDASPVSMLILDSKEDPAQFWSILKTKAEIALNELVVNERNAQAFPRGR